MSYSTQQQIISIPIPAKFRETALEFAQEQPTQPKAKQVYVNTLAVLVINSYLEMLEIPTDLEGSYCWNQYGRLMADVADLLLTGVGRLECRAIRTGDTNCHVPPEVWHNRIGYVVVELNKTCTEGKVRGFLPDIKTSEIDIEQLQPLERLIESSHLVHLRQWLEGIYKSQWQSMEELSRQRSPQLAFRFRRIGGFQLDKSEEVWKVIEQLYPHRSWENNLPSELLEKMSGNQVQDVESAHHNINSLNVTDVLTHLLKTTEDEEKRWKLAETLWTIEPNHPAISARRIIDLGMQLASHPVALMVAILSKPDKTVAVLLRVYPIGNQPYLPPGLQLAGLYENGQPFLEVKARVVDNYIQLKFCAEFGERFGVQVSINNASITENFVI
ncbi:DUF1822 family protein [Scytonema tolypothrichoides VB-61278]|nr:DUF1822 family protein [Scytonema tolypothrichoides VB-61278]